MNIEEIREYCLFKPGVTEGFSFQDTALVFKVGGKMFATLGMENEVGRMNLIYIADARGHVLTEMSCIRHGEDDFTLMTAAATATAAPARRKSKRHHRQHHQWRNRRGRGQRIGQHGSEKEVTRLGSPGPPPLAVKPLSRERHTGARAIGTPTSAYR